MLKDQSSYVDNLTVKVLRIAYTHKIPTDIGPHLNMISSKVFVPARLSRVRCENLPQTLFRTDCWLKCTGMATQHTKTLHALTTRNMLCFYHSLIMLVRRFIFYFWNL